MKKLPIGMPLIGDIVDQNFVYVDKTDLIYKLITNGQSYLLSRPRRFGKSLLLSTFEAIFKGDKELFKNCHIYNTDYEWQKHPVIYLDFAKIRAQPRQVSICLEKGFGRHRFVIRQIHQMPKHKRRAGESGNRAR